MNKAILGMIVIVLGVLAGWYVVRSADSGTEGTTTGSTTGPSTASGQLPVDGNPSGFSGVTPGSTKGGVVTEKAAISYTDAGFTPVTMTVKLGTTVTFTNNSSKSMWVASAVHPTHQLLPGFDQLKSVPAGGTYEYTFVKVGTWKYHNHSNASDTGSVVVTQ